MTSEDPLASVDWVVPDARAEDSTLGTIVGIVSTFVRLSVVPDARAEESTLGTTVGIVSISVRLSVVPILVKISVVPEVATEELALATTVGIVSASVKLSVVRTSVKISVVPEARAEELAVGMIVGIVSTSVKLSVVPMSVVILVVSTTKEEELALGTTVGMVSISVRLSEVMVEYPYKLDSDSEVSPARALDPTVTPVDSERVMVVSMIEVDVYELITALVLANLVEIEVPETVGREIMSVVSIGELSDRVTEDTVGSSMSEVVPMYSVEVHCDKAE